MTITVIDQTSKKNIGFPDLFALEPPAPGHIVILGGVMDPSDLTSVPAEVVVTEKRLEVSALGGTFVLDLERLVEAGSSTGGWAYLSVPDRVGGGRILEALGAMVSLEPPRPSTRPGPLQRSNVGLSVSMTDDGLVVQITTEVLGLRLSLRDSDGKNATLAVALPELAEVWDVLVPWWCRHFRDGLAPRVTRAEDPSLSSDDPWIERTSRITVPSDTDLSGAAFGGDELFAMHTLDDSSVVLGWRADGSEPREVARFPLASCGLYPSPDGRWLVVSTTVPGDDGSLTHGSSALVLVDVATGEPRTLCTKDAALVFGDTSGTVHWSADGQRFSFGAKLPIRGDRDGERNAIAVFDVTERTFVDILVSTHLAFGWRGTRLEVRELVSTDVGEGSEWRSASWSLGSASPSVGDVSVPTPDGKFLVEVEDDALVVTAIGGQAGERARRVPIGTAHAFANYTGGHFLVDGGLDARVVDLARGEWRYLVHRGSGEPRVFSNTHPVVVFKDEEGWRIGRSSGVETGPRATLEWPKVEPDRVALASAHMGNHELALAALTKVTDAATSAAVREVVAQRQASLAFDRGMREHSRTEQIEAFAEAVRLDPDWLAANRNLALALRKHGDFARALDAINVWLSRAPEDDDALVDRSIALQNLARYDEALTAIDLAIAAAPTDGTRHYQRACVLALAGRSDDAVTSVREAASLDPELAPAMGRDEDLAALRGQPDFAPFEAAAIAARALERHQQGDDAGARDAFRQAALLARSPLHLQNWCVLASRLGDTDDSLAATAAFLERASTDDNLGLLVVATQFRCLTLLDLGRHEEALPLVEVVLDHGDPRGGVLATFARVFGANERLPEAARMIELIIEEAPAAALGILTETTELASLRASEELTRLVDLANAAAEQSDYDEEDEEDESRE